MQGLNIFAFKILNGMVFYTLLDPNMKHSPKKQKKKKPSFHIDIVSAI